MLHKKTVEPSTLSLLIRLQQLPELSSYYLVGGTALALWYGHRISVDIDLFGKEFNKEKLIEILTNEFGSNFQYEQSSNKWALFCFINNIKVDIVKYEQPLLYPIEINNGISILNTLDIAAMKINAILGRASKKDFWDIKELMEHYTLSEIIDAHQKKYPNQMLLISILQALSYFEEAAKSENPICLRGYSWGQIKKYIKNEVRIYLS
ncbi:MAG: nucleotidyl transferase AbiEii/AbiGii toxin family protein [Cyclobacteriaceae bacterium]|nr:nucleotidyl transferase AbiEii/AbiGii toxin family protein [Cyclobacteriaceae bacterium]